MGRYRFVTTWEFDAAPEDVWTYVGDPLEWTSFWPGLEDVRPLGREGGTPDYRLVFKSFLPYTLALDARIARSDPPRELVMDTTGELRGRGTFTLLRLGPRATRTRLVWETETTLLWMNLSAPVLRGLFEWNHDVLMRRAGNGLADRLGARVTHREATGTSLPRALLPLGGALLGLWLTVRLLARAGRA